MLSAREPVERELKEGRPRLVESAPGESGQKMGSRTLNQSGGSFVATLLHSIMSKSLGPVVRWSDFETWLHQGGVALAKVPNLRLRCQFLVSKMG